MISIIRTDGVLGVTVTIEEWIRLQNELEDLRDANAALLAQIAYLTGEDHLAAMEDIEAFIEDES